MIRLLIGLLLASVLASPARALVACPNGTPAAGSYQGPTPNGNGTCYRWLFICDQTWEMFWFALYPIPGHPEQLLPVIVDDKAAAFSNPTRINRIVDAANRCVPLQQLPGEVIE